MSDVATQEITLDDLNHFWSAEGLPVFYADRDDICDIVEGMGFSIYYLLANYKKEVKPPTNNNKQSNNNNKQQNNGKQTTSFAPTYVNETHWFKVVNNFVGRTVSKCSPSLSDDFVSVQESAHYTMPPIPHVIVDKLDQFFRLVDAQHGTESIVMLTYDTTKEGSEGWGILVPDQENTSAHCNYDPHSIAEMKPDHVMIVGSVHSHPKMAAYASGTDHADQADFDGIHITYGWQKSVNNGATQYHLELQMAGTAYTLNPEDVFEDFTIQKEPDPDVVEWSSKVKKELPLPSRAGEYISPSLPPQVLRQAPISLGTGLPKVKSYDELDWVKSLKNIFETCEVPYGSIIVGEIDVEVSQDHICPSCDASLDYYCVYDGFCDVCFIPLSAKGTSVAEVAELAFLYANHTGISTDQQVYLVGFEDQKDRKNLFVMPVCETSLKDQIGDKGYSESYYDSLDLDSNSVFDYLICCGIHIDDIESCFCSPRITYDDYLDYEKLQDEANLYKDKYVNCIGCEHYYSPSCNQMKSLLVDFMKDPRNHFERLSFGEIKNIDGLNCSQYRPYLIDTAESSLYYD